MKKRTEKKIKAILEGRTEPEEAIQFLKRLKDDEVSALFEKEELSGYLASYYSRNKDLGIVPDLSKKKEEELWGRITNEDKEQMPVYKKTDPAFASFYDSIRVLLTIPSRYRYGALAMALILLVIIPVSVLHMTQNSSPVYYSVKGDDPGVGFSFEIARMVEGNMLVRPDRPFTEDDLIAFQVKADQEGFCSIFVVYGELIDTVIRNMSTAKGTNVVRTIYNPKGNKGKNIVIMQFTQKKLSLNDSEQMKMVMEVAKKSITTVNIDGEPVFFKFLNIVVN